MRRALGFLLMASVLRLTAFDVQTECERHAEDAAPAAASTTGHEHHAIASPSSNDDAGAELPVPDDADSESEPKCCVVTGTCGASTLADGVVSRVSVGDASAAVWVPALSAPRATLRAPEPPPPKA